jgi:DNA-binding beta-propeller fold protein YncE
MNRRQFVSAAAAAPVLLAYAPHAFARRFGGTPVALVTADTKARVTAVHLTTGEIYRQIATLPGPRSIETVGAVAVVAHTSEGAVSLIDAASLRVRRVLRGFGEPRYTAAGRNGLAYVTDSARGEVVVIDSVRGRVVHRTEVGGPARHLSLAGNALWVALGTKAERVVILDVTEPLRPRVLGRIAPPFLAHDVGFTPGGARVWVSSGDRGALAVYDARSRRRLFSLPAGAPPQHITFLNRTAHVTSGHDGTLRVHSLDGHVLKTTRIPQGSYNVQNGWGVILTPSLSRGTLCVLGAGGRLRRRVHVAPSSHDACFVMAR